MHIYRNDGFIYSSKENYCKLPECQNQGPGE